MFAEFSILRKINLTPFCSCLLIADIFCEAEEPCVQKIRMTYKQFVRENSVSPHYLAFLLLFFHFLFVMQYLGGVASLDIRAVLNHFFRRTLSIPNPVFIFVCPKDDDFL